MSDYIGVVTNAGQTKIAAAIGGAALNLTTVRVGDGNGAAIVPNPAMADLVRRVGAAYPIISSGRDPVNSNHWRVTALIPAGDGPFDIREIGVFDADGAMIAIAKHVFVEKRSPAAGAAVELTTDIVFPVSETAQVTVEIQPAAAVSIFQMLRAGFTVVESATVAAPPGAPALGRTHVVPAGAGGAWTGLAGMLVQWNGIVWVAVNAPAGHLVVDQSKSEDASDRWLRRTAGGWVSAQAAEAAYGLVRLASSAEAAAFAAGRALTPQRGDEVFARKGRQILTSTGLTGGGTLASDRTLALDYPVLDSRYAPNGPLLASFVFNTSTSGWGGTQYLSGTAFGGAWNPATNTFTFTAPRANAGYFIEGSVQASRFVENGTTNEHVPVVEPLEAGDIASKSPASFTMTAPTTADTGVSNKRRLRLFYFIRVYGYA